MTHTHGQRLRRRLSKSLRMRTGALVFALLALTGVFADLLAADAPIIAFGGEHGVVLFPAIVRRTDVGDNAALWPLVHYGPETIAEPSASSSWAHPLGTDVQGRDVFARLVHGTRAALGLAMVALVLALLFGVLLGAFAGYAGGFWDELLARPAELVETFPAIVVVAVVRAVAPEHTAWSLAIAVAAVRWAEIARLVRAEVIRFGSADFVEAARALGCSHTRILRRHILPHALRPVIVTALFAVPSVVLLEAAVSFLGFGFHGSWGVMIASGGWRAPLFGLLALGATVGASYLCADALGEALDARVAATSLSASWRATRKAD